MPNRHSAVSHLACVVTIYRDLLLMSVFRIRVPVSNFTMNLEDIISGQTSDYAMLDSTHNTVRHLSRTITTL
jgi:hypothetical protein